jgi:surfeit locus 1 family protein
MAFSRPTSLTLMLGLVCLAILIGLGIWQLERREWKLNLIANIDARIAEPAVPLPAEIGLDWEFRRVTVEGKIAAEQWFRFPGRSRDGQVGEALFLLLREADGRLIAVDQTFIAFGDPLPPLPEAVSAAGVLREPERPSWFTPDNDPAANEWYVPDPAAMATAAGLGEVAASGDVLPLYLAPASWRPHLPNDHLQYALTWFSFAFILVVIFVLFHRTRPESRSA